MGLYLYLNEHWHVDAWVTGGLIPISPASTYKSMERDGIFTPDENLIHNSAVDIRSLRGCVDVNPALGVRGLTMIGCERDGVPIPNFFNADFYEDDGLILSFSSRLTGVVARKMKKKACVKIIDMDGLRRHLDETLGVQSIAGYCEYTESHERNHFLKSELDSWQAEYRLFWPIKERVEVQLLPGVAELICTW